MFVAAWTQCPLTGYGYNSYIGSLYVSLRDLNHILNSRIMLINKPHLINLIHRQIIV